MKTYQIEMTITQEGMIIVQGLPLHVGEKVKVIIRHQERRSRPKRYPLRGQPYQYDNPFQPVASEDWAAL